MVSEKTASKCIVAVAFSTLVTLHVQIDKSNNHHPPSLGPGSPEGLEGREFDDENLPGQVQGYLIHMHGGGELESRHASVLARGEG